MENKKRRRKKGVTWGLGVIIADSDGKKIGRLVKIPKRLMDKVKPIKNSAFLDPQYEEIMKFAKSYKPRKR